MTSLCAPPEAGLRSPALGAGHAATSIRLLRSTAPTISSRSFRNSRNPRPRKTEPGVCVPGRVGLLCDPPFPDRHAWRSEGIGVTDPFQAPAYIPHVPRIRSTARTPRHASWRGAFHCDVAVAAATSFFSQSVALFSGVRCSAVPPRFLVQPPRVPAWRTPRSLVRHVAYGPLRRGVPGSPWRLYPPRLFWAWR